MKIFERIMCKVRTLEHRPIDGNTVSEQMEFVTLEFDRKEHNKFFEALCDAMRDNDFIDIHFQVDDK